MIVSRGIDLPYFVPSFPRQWTNQDILVVDDPQSHQKHNQHSLLENDFFQHHQLIPAVPYKKRGALHYQTKNRKCYNRTRGKTNREEASYKTK